MKRKDILKFAAIETKYNGYKFRSRLEARHAVFFDTLGIKYYYEHEGYNLNGTYYLPDFYLPELDCFVEIKGQEPTGMELEKVRRLAVYTGKDAFLISGNIGSDQEIFYADAPVLFRTNKYEETREKIEISPEVRAILQELYEASLIITVKDHELGISLEYPSVPVGTEGLKFFTKNLQLAHQGLERLTHSLILHREDLIKALHTQEGWSCHFNDQNVQNDFQWVECQVCEIVSFGISDCGSLGCMTHIEDTSADSPRLIAAYTAARQARFDGR